jgi:hypothetical protein
MDLIGHVEEVAHETFRATIEIADIKAGESFGMLWRGELCGSEYLAFVDLQDAARNLCRTLGLLVNMPVHVLVDREAIEGRVLRFK